MLRAKSRKRDAEMKKLTNNWMIYSADEDLKKEKKKKKKSKRFISEGIQKKRK